MDWVPITFCKLCLKEGIMEKRKVIDQVIVEVFAVLSLNVGFDERGNYMCNDCSVKLFAAFDFKAMCLNTEDSLFPFVESKKASLIDLQNVYLKINGEGKVTVTSDQQVCRLCLCMNIVDDGFVYLEELSDANMVEKYIPEVNFSITKDPVVCKQCWNSLTVHIDSLRQWMDIQEKIKRDAYDPEDYFCIESEEIDPVLEENKRDMEMFLLESNEIILKDETIKGHCAVEDEIEDMHTSHSSSSQSAQENCPEYDLNGCEASYNKISCELVLVDPQLQSSSSLEVCSFQAEYDRYLKEYQYGDPSEIRKYKCSECDYQCKRKNRLKIHQIVHKDLSEIQMYKCSECDYQSKWKSGLQKHQIRHKDPRSDLNRIL